MRVREVVIFRHNLFKISEPFITQQAQKLRRYTPVYLGRLRFGASPEGAAVLSLQDLGARGLLLRVGWHMISRNIGPFLRLLRGHRPALIHAHFGIEGVYALPLAKRLDIPLITMFHGYDATLSTAALLTSPALANYPLFRGQLAQGGDLFLCASSFIRERVLALGFPEARTRVHYIGVDCQAIQPRAAAEETPVILHVARLVEVKGTQVLLQAFQSVARHHAEAQLVIIGDGPLRRSLEAQAQALGLAQRVRFLGALPHVRVLAWMRKAAMLVLPSVRTATGRVEGLGMVMLEAAATGVPVIGSRLGGIPEGIRDGETGFLVPERDPAALAERMGQLLADPATRRRMGAQARAFVARNFDIDRQTEILEQLYDEVLARRHGSDAVSA